MSTQTSPLNPSPKRPDQFYVAPKDPPASRRPPTREIGLTHWLRENLFSTPIDTVLTLITLVVLGAFLLNFLDWALLTAQWEIVFNNLRVFNVGNQFPIDAVWRAQLVGAILVFLGLLSIGVWGRLLRWQIITLMVIAALMLIVPFFSQFVPEPSVYTYLDARYAVRQVNFIAQEGQTITFTIDPLTSPEDFRLETITGYIENDNQQANTAFDSYAAASTEVLFNQTRDPAQYDLSMAVQVWDNTGAVIAQSEFSSGSTDDTVLTWTAPYSGWFTYTAISDTNVPSTQGIAWLRADNLEIYRSTISAQRERLALYGEAPILNCPRCATQANRTDMRYQGHRTLPQWFSLQLAPFFLETRSSFFVALLLGALAYGIGTLAKHRRLALLKLPSSLEAGLARAAAAVGIGYIIAQFTGVNGANPATSGLAMALLALLVGIVSLYALALLVRGGEAASSRAVTLLWAVSFPVMLTLLNGVAGIPELKQIPSAEQGGLILTLLLSSVAIIVSFPIGLLLALGRRSALPVVSGFCTAFIEIVRGVPLITLIFGGWLILPFFGFGLQNVDLLIRIMVVLTLFTSAYLAEVIRGGLQTIPKGQLEAAHALGLNDFYTNGLIVIPQALRLVIPAMMGQAVSLFKDTSLVYVIGLFELVGVTNQILGDAQTGYLMFPREAYLFVGIVYFVFSYIMAEASRRIEKTGSGAIRRETI